jgi:hypothetical protein
LFFEVMKDILKALVCEPSAGFFDGIAVGYAVNGNGGVFHEVRRLQKRKESRSQRQSYPYENIE